MRRQRAFTLVEILITLTVAAILAAVVLPSYGDYVKRAKIADAVGQLATMRPLMEEYFLDNRTYVGACTPGTIAPLPSGEDARHFDFACTNLSGTTYVITATGKAAEGMGDFAYSVDQNNVRASLSVPEDWIGSATCWTLRRDGSC